MTSDRFGFSERHGFTSSGSASKATGHSGDKSMPCRIPVIGGIRFFVAAAPVRGLLLCAKHLFVEAMVAGAELLAAVAKISVYWRCRRSALAMMRAHDAAPILQRPPECR